MKIRLLVLMALISALFYPAALVRAQGDIPVVAIAYGQSAQGEVKSPDEPVIYGFEGKAGDKVSIQVTASGSGFELLVALFSRDGTQMAASRDGVITGQTLPQDDIYLILVGAQSGGGRFTITLKNSAAASSSGNIFQGVGSQGQTAGGNGRIAFASDFSGMWEIYTVNPDGSDRQQLTSGPGSKFTPMWSPDGTQIVYRYVDETKSVIYLMNADGSNAQPVTDGRQYADFTAAWSPDGSLLVVSSGTAWNACDIYVMNIDGSNRTLVADTGQSAYSPVWMASNTQIIFNKVESGTTNIYSVNVDGSQLKLLVSDARDVSLSPDGATFAISSNRNGNWDIYLVQGKQLIQVTQTAQEEARPMWSPDGKSISFMQSADGGQTWKILAINLTTGEMVEVSNNSGNSVDNSWSPR